MSEWRGSIALVNPPYAIGRSYHLAPPLGLQVLAGALKSEGVEDVTIHDLALELAEGTLPAGPALLDAAAARLAAIAADVYGFSLQCFNLPIAIAVAERLRRLQPDARIVAGGHHATLLGTLLTKRFPCFDAVFSGPGEATVGRRTFAPPDFDSGPAWSRYASVSRQAVGLVEVGRGCPFDCSFCSIPVSFGRHIQHRPADAVVADIAHLASIGCTDVHLVDDILTVDPRYMDDLLSALTSARLDVTWTAMSRVDLVSPHLLERMHAAGCRSILYGVESADPGTRRLISKRAHRYPDLLQFANDHTSIGIQPTMYFLINVPGESEAGLRRTLDAASRISVIDPGACHFNLPRFVSGTALAAEAAGRLTPHSGTPYADTLVATVGIECGEVWRTIDDHVDLCSTYCVAPGPVDTDTAVAIAWVGGRLFERFPLTTARLAEAADPIAVFRRLGMARRGREWASITDEELAALLNDLRDSATGDLGSLLDFEAWRASDGEAAGADASYFVSSVDVAEARLAASDPDRSIGPALFGRARVYRRSGTSLRNQEGGDGAWQR